MVIVVRVIDGALKPGTKIRLMAEGQDYEVEQVGIFSPKAEPIAELAAGEVGFLVANIKTVADAKIGDTITETNRPDRHGRFPGSRNSSRWCSRGCIPWRAISTRSFARRSRSCG